MRTVTRHKTLATSLLVCGLVLARPFLAAAQEPAPAQQTQPAEKIDMPGMKGHGHRAGMMAEMQKMHAEMERMHQEMSQELQQQLTALREHTKAMDTIGDDKQLLKEMQKHQQMTDTLFSTMVEQHEKMHAQMESHHRQMQSQMGKWKQPQTG